MLAVKPWGTIVIPLIPAVKPIDGIVKPLICEVKGPMANSESIKYIGS